VDYLENKSLLSELQIWLAAERATPVLLQNDPDLLDRVNVELAEMRCEILRGNNEIFADYKETYNTLCDVLMCRIDKVK